MSSELGPDGRIVTLERNPERIRQALDFWARGGVTDRIELVAGDALESLGRLDGPFDLVFLDAAKTEIDAYLERLDGRLAPHALLVIDNLLMSGEAALPEGLDTSWGEESLRAARRTTRALMESPDWLFSLLPVGDGVGLGARRGTVST
jgi:predicted O-methyltransferase YrrM